MSELLHFSLPELISTIGYVGIFAIVFAESGLPFGFILPGDSLLFAAGLLAASGYLSLVPLVVVIVTAAILGDSAGYWLGAKFGPRIFAKEDAFWFNKKRIEDSKRFYDRYGARSLILARFIPVVRTFVPIFAGVAKMPYKRFLAYNVMGGILWGAGIPVLGYAFGSVFPDSEHYILPGVALIIVVSMIPIAFELYRARKSQ